MASSWIPNAGMVATWAVWMLGSAIHYTFLPRCLARSLCSVIKFAMLQAAATGFLSWLVDYGRRNVNTRNQPQPLQQKPLKGAADAPSQMPTLAKTSETPALSLPRSHGCRVIVIAGAAFAIAITMTNASVAHGSVAGSRIVKSLEPPIVRTLQLLAGMEAQADLPWVFLLAIAVSMMLAVAPTGITAMSAAAALLSTAAIATRNVFVKRQMIAIRAATPPSMAETPAEVPVRSDAVMASTAWVTDIQTQLNLVACGILMATLACVHALWGAGHDSRGAHSHVATVDVAITCGSFAAFQVAALMVLERVSPTRQAAIKSLQNASTTAWTLLTDTNGHGRHNALELVPAIVWGACVVALASGEDIGLLLPSAFCRFFAKRRMTSMDGIQTAAATAHTSVARQQGVEIVVPASASGETAVSNAKKWARTDVGQPEAEKPARVAWATAYYVGLTALIFQFTLVMLNRLSFNAGQSVFADYRHHGRLWASAARQAGARPSVAFSAHMPVFTASGSDGA